MPARNLKEYNHKYYTKNKERLALEHKEWKEKNLTPEKQSEYFRRWYKKNGNTKDSRYGREFRDKLKINAVNYKGGKCMDCGFDNLKRLEVFDFDHTTNKKKDKLSALMRSNNWEVVKKELDICDLVCSNCHRTRTKRRHKN